MNTYANLRYHLIFRTLDFAPLLTPPHGLELCRYVNAIVKRHQGMLLEAAAQPDHVHLLLGTRPSVALADLVRVVKASSSKWLNENNHRPGWFRWEPGYGAFTVSESQVSKVQRFIQNQHKFHQATTLDDEFVRFVEKHGFEYDATPGERYTHTYPWLRIHVIFTTKLRMPLISETLESDLYEIFGQLATKNRAKLVDVGGIADHVHLILAPHQSVSVADLLRSIKNESTYWMRERLGGDAFFAWQRGYGVFSISSSQISTVCKYVGRQKAHHQKMTTEDEFRRLLIEHGLDIKNPEPEGNS